MTLPKPTVSRLFRGVLIGLFTTGTAYAQSLPQGTIEKVETLLTQKMNAARTPGMSVAIVVDGRLAWARGFGMADLEHSVPATAHTAYRSASVGKTITATAAMQLAERGLLDLDAPVQKYCAAFPEKRWRLTSRHLLAHLGGIRHYGGPRNDEELFSNKHYDSVVDALEIFKDDPLLFEPGTQYLYSTYGYNVLGCVLEGASGMDFLSFLSENIFKPAHMNATRDDDPFAIIPNRASGYRFSADGAELLRARAVDMSNKMPAGGFITTASDLALFTAALMNGDLVADSTLELMLTPQKTRDGEQTGYGLGWGLFPDELWYGEREAFHGGGTPGVSTMLYMIPDRGFAVAWLTNLESVTDRVQLTANIAVEVLNLAAAARDENR